MFVTYSFNLRFSAYAVYAYTATGYPCRRAALIRFLKYWFDIEESARCQACSLFCLLYPRNKAQARPCALYPLRRNMCQFRVFTGLVFTLLYSVMPNT